MDCGDKQRSGPALLCRDAVETPSAVAVKRLLGGLGHLHMDVGEVTYKWRKAA